MTTGPMPPQDGGNTHGPTLSTHKTINFLAGEHILHYLPSFLLTRNSVLVLASPRLRLLDPATTMRYKHVCKGYIPIYRWFKEVVGSFPAHNSKLYCR